MTKCSFHFYLLFSGYSDEQYPIQYWNFSSFDVPQEPSYNAGHIDPVKTNQIFNPNQLGNDE